MAVVPTGSAQRAGWRVRTTAVLGVVGVVAALLVPGGVADAGRTPPADGWNGVYAGFGRAQSFWLHLNGTPTSDAMLEREAKRHKYVVLNAWEGAQLGKLKASNPKVQVYVYQDLSSTRSYACKDGVDDEHLPAGVGYCAADRDHPEWFLLDQAGRRFEYDGYPGHWQMDVGDTAYQDAWAARVIAEATAGGFDGVFMDNALFPCDAYHPGTCPAKYRTDAQFQAAYQSMLANLEHRFERADLKTVANLSSARLHPGAWDAYTEHLDGGFDEWWLVFDDDDLLPDHDEGWSRQVAEISSNEARGKITWVQPHFGPGRDRPLLYAMASYFLVVGSKAAIAEMQKTDGYGDPTAVSPIYGWNLGLAIGPRRSVAPGVFRRDFTCGAVFVNANTDRTEPVRLRVGADYVDESGAKVSSVTLGGTSGSILRRVVCPTP